MNIELQNFGGSDKIAISSNFIGTLGTNPRITNFRGDKVLENKFSSIT
jgi:hypothetical protein